MKNFIPFLLCLLCGPLSASCAESLNKICLAMVVKNDAAVIRACLESARPIIDYLSVCDLGCTDGTIEEIVAFAKESNIPVSITPMVPEEDESRHSLAIDAGKSYLSHLGIPLVQTYLLLLEADAICRIGSDFTKQSLQRDTYFIRETSSLLSCYTYAPRLVRATFSGNLHAIEEGEKLLSLYFDVNEHQAYNLRKLEREAVRLTKKMRKNPEDPHVLFELAGVHYGLTNYDKAQILYEERLKLDECGDEAWFSRYRLGEYFEAKELWTDAQYWYLEAYRHTPTRVEPLRRIATHYRLRGINDLAYLFAKQGQTTEVTPHVLYPIPPISEHEIDEELSICAYYTPHQEDGFLAANRLLLRRNISWHLKNQTYHNILFYVKNIKSSARLPVALERPLIREGSDERYYPMNPSIVKTEMGYDVICRTVNYTQMGSKYYNSMDLDGFIRTRNFFLRFDRNFSLLSQQEILEMLPRKKENGIYHIVGLEDCRLFSWNESPWCTCTTLDTSPHQIPQISLCKLANPRQGEPLIVEKLTPLLGPDPRRCEKNWLPFVKDNQFQVIYSSDPLVIYKPDLDTGICETVLFHAQTYDYSSFRGSAPPIVWNEGYLALIHEAVYHPDATRVLLHRLVYFDEQFHVKSLSVPFIFDHLGVEYCAGMTIDHSGTQLIFSVGLEDREAYFYFVDVDEIQSMLETVKE
jgi:tetratricopeptide (TPR) repeat protein